MSDFISIKIPKHITEIMNKLKETNYEVYVVGGAVRDSLLNKEVKDYDLTTSANLQEIKEVLKEYKIINANGERHGTVTIRSNHENVEITTFKCSENEENSSNGITADLLHRDITINAMAYDIEKGLVDLYHGRKDLDNKIIRGIENSYDRFREDPLRILRALRFSSQLDFKIDDETSKAINELKEELSKVSVERIKKELDGILTGVNVKEVLLNYRDVIGIIIPEIILTFDFDQRNRYHRHDVYRHIVEVVSNTFSDSRLRMAALLHDIAKPLCYTENVVDGVVCGHFYNHPIEGVKIASKILKRLKYSNEETTEILFLIEKHDAVLNPTVKSVRKMMIASPNQTYREIEKLINLKVSDRLDHLLVPPIPGNELLDIASKIIEENECLKVTDLELKGLTLVHLGLRGKEIGDMLKELLTQVSEGKLENDYHKLKDYVKRKRQID